MLIRDDAWYSFKARVEFIDDENLKDRSKRFIAITSGPFAVEIRYCEQCWKSYINNKNFQSVSGYGSRPGIDHIKNLFYRHINYIIFEEHEIRTLQSLRSDYVRMLNNHGLDSDGKSSYAKDLLITEFKDKIDFIPNSRRNGSELVYDTAGGRSYAEAIISSTGLSSEQIVRNAALRLNSEVSGLPSIPYPPYLNDLEKDEELTQLLLRLLTWLKNPSSESIDYSPGILSLASFLTSYIKNKPTLTAINLSVISHGLTKNKEFLYKHEIGISYKSVLMLRDFWTYNDLINTNFCPVEISEGSPCVVVVDNDDFNIRYINW